MKKYLLPLIFLVLLFISCSEEEPILPTSISSFTVSSQRVKYNQEVDLRVILDNETSDQSIGWYLNKIGESSQEIGSGKTATFLAPKEAGQYIVSVELENDSYNSYEAIDTIEVYGWAEEWFRRPTSTWGIIGGANIETSSDGAAITLAEGKTYGGLATDISKFVEGEIVAAPFKVIAGVSINSEFDQGDYIVLSLQWKSTTAYKYLKYTDIALYPKLHNDGYSWTPNIRAYNTSTEEFENAASEFAYLTDKNSPAILSGQGAYLELSLEVTIDNTVIGVVNDSQMFSLGIDGFNLESDQLSWELERINVVSGSGIILNRVLLQ